MAWGTDVPEFISTNCKINKQYSVTVPCCPVAGVVLVPLVEVVVDDGSLSIGSGSPSVAPKRKRDERGEGEGVGKGIIDQGKNLNKEISIIYYRRMRKHY